jgi:ActR/RegA family two-component response regulator
MSPINQGDCHRVLLVDDDEAVRIVMSATLEKKGFEVVSAASVPEALKFITTEGFDAVITDLHMPNPSDGFAVITAMRHSQPDALTLLVSGYPDVKSAVNAILLEADQIMMKPFEVEKLADLIREKTLTRKCAPKKREKVAAILERCMGSIVEQWLVRVKKNKELSKLILTDQQRTGYLPRLIADLVLRLNNPNPPGEEGDSVCSAAAVAHGKMRQLQGYTPGMLVHDSRILQVTLFATLQDNLGALDFSLVLPDIMTIADEVDSQLMQAMEGYPQATLKPAAA